MKMDSVTVYPSKGFGAVLFDDPRDVVRQKLGTYTEFLKTKSSKNSTDDFGVLHAYYDEGDKLEAVEFFEGTIFLGDKKVFPNTKRELFLLLKELDSKAIATNDAVISRDLCICAYAPSEVVETFLVHRFGYYD